MIPGFYIIRMRSSYVDRKQNRTKAGSTHTLSSNTKGYRCRAIQKHAYLVGVEDEVQLAHVLEALV